MPTAGKQTARLSERTDHVDHDRRRRRPSSCNDEGFFVHPEQWTEDMAPELARREGIDELTDDHWQRHPLHAHRVLAKGTGPTVRVLGKTSGVSIKELYQLFPKGPAKIAAKIAGIPKPRGCI